jgi:hypothetical protein
MAKQRKTLPARRKNGIGDDSLLIRSAESLGRMIGSLQRQLDAARQLTVGDGHAEEQRDGHAPARKRAAKSISKSKSAATKTTTAAAHKSNGRARVGAKQVGGKQGGGKQGAAKTDRVRSKQQRDRRARESGK